VIFEDKFSHFVKKQQFKLIISKPYYSGLDQSQSKRIARSWYKM